METGNTDNISKDKRYYWLKLPKSYFSHLKQKKMRKHEHGKDMQIVYLRMMLLSIDKGGYIYYQGVYETLEEELAEEFDEPVEIIRETLEYLKENNMIVIDENSDCFVPESLKLTGSECASAERMRKKRQRDKASQCYSYVTTSDRNVTDSDNYVTSCDVEIETEIETENDTVSKDTVRQTDVRRALDEWNQLVEVGVKPVSRLNNDTNRYKMLLARIREYGIDEVLKAIQKIRCSKFLRGGSASGWTIDFDWFVRPNNFPKVLEGKYDDSDVGNTPAGDNTDKWQ